VKVGFIGLGNMGGAIARQLARSGFAVTGCDVSEQVLAGFDEPGTSRTGDPLEAAADAAMLGICVRTDAQLSALAGDAACLQPWRRAGLS
jgi:3-hydroxyisobutyrate dehydrogenase